MWKKFPPDFIRKQILITGGAFRMNFSRDSTQPEKKRYCFILNLNPSTDELLILQTATTSTKIIQTAPAEDIVRIRITEYRELEKDSFVDCGRPILIKQKDFVQKISDREIQPLSPLPDEILKRIRKAIAGSKRLDYRQKMLILGNPEQQ